MAVTDEIAIKLGIKTGDLKAALTDAGAAIKQFKKAGEAGPDEGFGGQLKGLKASMREFKELLVAGGISEAVKRFFDFAIEGAKASKDATDKNVIAVKEFASAFEEAHQAAQSVAVSVVGFFNRIGEKIGEAINLQDAFARRGIEGVKQQIELEKQVEETARAAAEAEARLAEVKKKNGAEFLAITKELADLQKKSDDQKLKGLDVYETERNLLIKVSELRHNLLNFEGDAIDKRRLQVELARKQLDADDATLAVRKAQADVEKKLAEERMKEAEEDEKAFTAQRKSWQLSIKDESDLLLLRSKSLSELTAAERTRLGILELQKKVRFDEAEIERLMLQRLEEGLTPGEEKQLKTLITQKTTLDAELQAKLDLAKVTADEQLPAEEAVTAEIKRQVQAEEEAIVSAQKGAAALDAFYKSSIRQTGNVENLNDVQLQALIAKLNKELFTTQQNDAKVVGPGSGVSGGYKSIDQYIQQQNLDAAIKELSLRNQFRTTVQAFGDQYAQQQYDAGSYARLSQLFNPDQMKKDSNNLATVASGLQSMFPDKFTGAVR